MIPFALADIRKDNLGRPFFQKYIQKINIQHFNMNFKQSFKDQLTIASFTKLIEKNFASFSFNNQINSKQPTYIKANTVQTLHFPIKFKTFIA